MLGELNLLLIIIIFIVIGINTYLTLKNNYQFKQLKATIDNIDITYLKEFQELDPFLKNLYRKYISGAVVPIVIKKFNSMIANEEAYKSLKANPKEVEKIMDAFVIQFKAGVESMSIEDLLGFSAGMSEEKEVANEDKEEKYINI